MVAAHTQRRQQTRHTSIFSALLGAFQEVCWNTHTQTHTRFFLTFITIQWWQHPWFTEHNDQPTKWSAGTQAHTRNIWVLSKHRSIDQQHTPPSDHSTGENSADTNSFHNHRVRTEKSIQNSQTFHKPLQHGTKKHHEGMQLCRTSGKGVQPLL